MEAVIVAGGLGTRLRPLTARHPKHVLPVAGVPFLAHQLSRLAAAGAQHVVLATSYRAAQLAAALGERSFGVPLTYVREQVPLGTGGALRNALDALTGGADDPVLVLNGDQLSDHDLAGQFDRFRQTGADVSLHLVAVADPRPYGSVSTDPGGRVTGFHEKSPDPPSRRVNAGCYVFRRRLVDAIPAGQVVSMERETFPRLLREGRMLVAHRDDGYWTDIGTPQALVRASRDLVRGVVRSPALTEPAGEALVHPSARVHADARVTGGSAIGPGAVVGDGALVDGSVLMAGVVLAEGATVVRSVVGPTARVGARTTVESAVLGDGADVGASCELRHGARVGCDVRIPAAGLSFGPN